MDLYECSKRYETGFSHFAYDIDKETFINVTDTVLEKIELGKIPAILFIDSYQTCLHIIDEYLTQPDLEKYREGAYRKMHDESHSKVIAFLWYFEHIDGTYSFGKFERRKVFKIITKWALKNGFEVNFSDDKSELI